ncbi:MAG: hypothetical protein AAF394_15535 [Planctomycetota bacterium]
MSEGRGRIYVDKKVQGALARRIVVHWCIFFVVCMLCLFAMEFFVGDPALGVGGHLAAVWQKYAFFVLVMLAIVPSFVYDSLKLSNKFAGPMVRLRHGIQKITRGEEVGTLKFRKGDFWGDVADEFNEMRTSIEAAKARAATEAAAEAARDPACV